MPKILRIEKDNGQPIGVGCYDSSIFSKANEMGKEHGNKHPSIFNDLIVDISKLEVVRSRYDIYCACDTLRSLNKWFNGWFKDLFNEGFVIVEYTVKNYFKTKSNLQVGFLEEDIIKCEILCDNYKDYKKLNVNKISFRLIQ